MVIDASLANSLAALGEVLLVPKTAVLFDVGETGDGAYVIRAGVVALEMLNQQGTPIWSRTLGKGGILGLPAALGRRQHFLRAVARSNAELVFVPVEQLAQLIHQNGQLASDLLRVMSEEVADAIRTVATFKRTGHSHPQ